MQRACKQMKHMCLSAMTLTLMAGQSSPLTPALTTPPPHLMHPRGKALRSVLMSSGKMKTLTATADKIHDSV